MGEIIHVPEDLLQEFTIIDDTDFDFETTAGKPENNNIQRKTKIRGGLDINNVNDTCSHLSYDDYCSKNKDEHIKQEDEGIDEGHDEEDDDDDDDEDDDDELDEIHYNGLFEDGGDEEYSSRTNSKQSLAEEEHVLNIDSLMAMNPLYQGQDVVCIAAKHLFISKVKSQPCVKDVFFQNHKRDAYEYLVDSNWFDFETFAVLYICQVIAKCHDQYKLYTLIDEDKCDQHLDELPSFPEWKKVGFALYTTLFPDLVKDPKTCTPFRAYLSSDREYWARQMYDTVRDSRWLYKMIQPIIAGKVSEADYNRDINILFVKLHLLDPTLVMPAYHYLQKALPHLNLEIATTNYLGGPLDWKLVKPAVEEILYKPVYQRRVSKLSFESVDVYYGVEVLEFVMREARDLELLTDKVPDNRRTTTFKDRCTIM